MICRGIKSSVSHCTFLFGGKNGTIFEKNFAKKEKDITRFY